MRIKALFIRIVRQFLHDKRTLALLIIAPLFVLSLLYLVLNGGDYEPSIAMVNAPDQTVDLLKKQTDAEIIQTNREKAQTKLESAEIDAVMIFGENGPTITLEGSDPNANKAVLQLLNEVFGKNNQSAHIKINYLHGGEDLGTFDYLGPVFIGFFVFFFVFLISGVSFLRERTSGTLERLMASPIRRWEVVAGYILGFGFFTVIQTILILAYTVYVLGLPMAGSFGLVLLTTVLAAFTALTLGTLLSAFANNELQMIQFIPLVIVPQFFFSGIFSLETISDWVNWIGPLTPLYYVADALQGVMIRGESFEEIMLNLLIMLGFSLLFMTLNIVALRKHRKI